MSIALDMRMLSTVSPQIGSANPSDFISIDARKHEHPGAFWQ